LKHQALNLSTYPFLLGQSFRQKILTFEAAGGSLSTKPDTGIQPGTAFFSTAHSHANNSNELQSKGKDNNMYSQVKQKTFPQKKK
jgi:hypothetical protein